MTDLDTLLDEAELQANNTDTVLSNAESRGADQDILDILATASHAMDGAVTLLRERLAKQDEDES